MTRKNRRRRLPSALELLETRWLFSLTIAPQANGSEAGGSSHSGGCCCPMCSRYSGIVQVDSMVYLPPDSKLTEEQIEALANSDHGGGCSCPLCKAALGEQNPSVPVTDGSSSENFVTSGEKWPQPGGPGNPVTITYSLSNLLDDQLGGVLSDDAVYDAVEEALGLWAKYAPLNFVEVEDSGPDVDDDPYSPLRNPQIRFGFHAIDGRNDVLAHAYYPDNTGLAGDVHLDRDENWSTRPSFSNIDIIEVLTHELGHSLGLDHETRNAAIMNPFYSGRYEGPGTGVLLQDDINGIRAIYGTGVGSVSSLDRKPITEGEAFSLDEDAPLQTVASVLANDSDPNGDDLTALLVTPPAHGEIVLAADGTFQYTPDPNYFGSDSFTYQASNGAFQSEATTVSLTILPTMDPPVAAPDEYAVRTGDVLATGRQAETVVAAGSVWRYLDDGSNQGTAWREADFDDAGWSAGPAQLGYGEGDEATAIGFGGNAEDRHITTYFRQEFDLSDTARINTLDLRLMRDDGAAVYLNGYLIARSNLSSVINSESLALIDVAGSSETRFFTFTINVANLPAGTIREGRNVLAVELHQSRANSEDLSFDLSLTALRNVSDDPVVNDQDLDLTGLLPNILAGPEHGALEVEPDGSLVYTPTPGFVGQDVVTYQAASKNAATFVASGSSWRYLDTGANLGEAWFDPTFDDDDWKTGQAQLGYGDGDETTSIDYGSANNRYATTYFRKEFTLDDPAAVLSLEAHVLRDDAAAIYLNGAEIYRDDNLPADAGHAVYTGDPVDDEEAFVTFSIPTELLTAGVNVLAVEVHQSAANDNDLSFDLRLEGKVAAEPTTITIDVTPTIFGDVDFNGRVDLDDLNYVRGNFGGDASVLLGDANGDGAIDLIDLNAVRNNFGSVALAPAAVTASSPMESVVAAVVVTEPVTSKTLESKSPEGRSAAPSRSSRAWDAALLDLLATSDRSLSQLSTLTRKRLPVRST